jgi:hypothetical protein
LKPQCRLKGRYAVVSIVLDAEFNADVICELKEDWRAAWMRATATCVVFCTAPDTAFVKALWKPSKAEDAADVKLSLAARCFSRQACVDSQAEGPRTQLKRLIADIRILRGRD